MRSLPNDTGVARTTLHGYLNVLKETLLGYRLAPLQLKAKVKEVSTPKFYLFDTGVVRALSKTLDEGPKRSLA